MYVYMVCMYEYVRVCRMYVYVYASIAQRLNSHWGSGIIVYFKKGFVNYLRNSGLQKTSTSFTFLSPFDIGSSLSFLCHFPLLYSSVPFILSNHILLFKPIYPGLFFFYGRSSETSQDSDEFCDDN